VSLPTHKFADPYAGIVVGVKLKITKVVYPVTASSIANFIKNSSTGLKVIRG
jgi:hypothetical protein